MPDKITNFRHCIAIVNGRELVSLRVALEQGYSLPDLKLPFVLQCYIIASIAIEDCDS